MGRRTWYYTNSATRAQATRAREAWKARQDEKYNKGIDQDNRAFSKLATYTRPTATTAGALIRQYTAQQKRALIAGDVREGLIKDFVKLKRKHARKYAGAGVGESEAREYARQLTAPQLLNAIRRIKIVMRERTRATI